MGSTFIKKKAQALMRALAEAGYETRIVGGAVRDALLGREPGDFDLATTATPLEIKAWCEQHDISCVPTGVDHGTMTIIYKRTPFEVTTLRRDVSTDGRRATVAFSKNFTDDAQRRDFTVNALYEDKEGEIYDFVDGLRDIKNRTLRFVGDAQTRVQEDFLRILRLYRFWGQLDLQPAPEDLNAARAHISSLRSLSQERITSELLKILTHTRNTLVYQEMMRGGAMHEIIQEPEVDFPTWLNRNETLITTYTGPYKAIYLLSSFYKKDTHESFLQKRYVLAARDSKAMACFIRLTSFLTPYPDTAEAMGRIDAIENSLGEHQFLESFARIVEKTIIDHEMLKCLSQLKEIEIKQSALRLQKMPLNGHDLFVMEPDLSGQDCGIVLGRLKRGFRNSEWSTVAEGQSLAADYIRDARAKQKH